MERGNRQSRGAVDDYFGFSDAADENEVVLGRLFLKTPEFEDLKIGTRSEGSFVVTGSKGSGKTAICRYLSGMLKKGLLWRVDIHNRFLNVHAKDLGKYPAEVESVIVNVVLAELTKKVVEAPDSFPADGVKSAKALLPRITETFMKVLKAGKVKTPVLEWDLAKVLEQDKSRFTQFDIERYVKPLSECFAKAPALVLFDDIDDVFLGADHERYPTFVEGLIRAAKRVNLTFGKSVHFLVFLKYGIFRSFYERPRDYDKVRKYIEVLKWNEEELERLLALRIADREGLNMTSDTNSVLSRVFKPPTEKSIRAILSFLFERCSSGPRDVIDYCNEAVSRAKKPEITLEILRDCESQFSKDKIIQIYQDYGYTYPDIHQLIEECFHGSKPSYRSDDFRNTIFTRILGDQKIADRFGKYSYFESANVENMIQTLYTVGFIGYISKRDKTPTYGLSDPRGEDLFDAEEYLIHPAFRKALRIV